MSIQVLNIGKVKETQGQEKKYYLQMTPFELAYLHNKVKQINTNKLTVSSHLQKKIANKEIQVDLHKDIIQTLRGQYDIIEYNEKIEDNGTVDKRVVVKSKSSKLMNFVVGNNIVKKQGQVVFIISLIKNQVITSYFNMVGDNHVKVNMYRYNKNLKISI